METRMDTDFVERPADGITAVMCKVCREIKPSDQFKRTLSYAQAAARGYACNAPVHYESDTCHACKPEKRVNYKRMSKTQLNKLVALNKLHQFVVDDEIKRREKITRQRRHQSAVARWSKLREPLQKAIMENLVGEINTVRDQQRYAVSRGNPMVAQYLVRYLDCLVKLRAELQIKFERMKETPKYRDWEAFMDDDLRRSLCVDWRILCRELPVKTTARIRVPTITKFWFDDDEKPLLASLPSGRSPEAQDRLAQIGQPKTPLWREPKTEPKTPQPEPIDWDNL